MKGNPMLKHSILLSIIISLGIVLSVFIFTDSQTAMPFRTNYFSLNAEAKEQVNCLAENIYFESAYEPREGQLAVAFVTINRMNSGHFENNICGVVKQKVGKTCQFSWWCEEKNYSISTSKVLTSGYNSRYNDIRDLATYVYANYEKIDDPTSGALFYHADYVNPKWKNMVKTTQIGRHIFYFKTLKEDQYAYR
jgi:spore germination cell wall hydrolase CwlJ-like protein